MSQIVSTYLLDDLEESLSMEREEFFESQVQTFRDLGRPTRAVEVVDLILFTPKKEFILQRRSSNKLENAGLIDTTIGAIVPFGRSPAFVVMASTLRELKIPSFVFGEGEDFKETYQLLETYVNNSAIVQLADSRTANFKKTYNGESVVIANKYHLYLGVYGGPAHMNLAEVAGLTVFSASTLQAERASKPESFTSDLVFFLDEYEKKIGAFLRNLPT